MAKGERKRTMVYSNVHKKADAKSASKKNDFSDFDNEVFIGVKSFPKPNEVNKKKSTSKKGKSGQPVDKVVKKSKKKEQNKDIIEENPSKISKIKSLFNRKKDENILDGNEIEVIRENVKDDNEKIEKANKSKKIEQSEKQMHTNNKTVKKIVVNDSIKKPKLTKEQIIQMQKRRIIKNFSLIVLLITLLIGGMVYFVLSPVFNVKTIEVINNEKISSEQIVSMTGISLNTNTFKFTKKEVKERILKNPYIEDVTINRDVFSNKVKVTVKERTATIMLEYGNSYVYINNQGYILEISPVKIDTPLIKGYVTSLEDVKPGNRLNKEDLERLEVVLKIIESAQTAGIENLITEINIKNKKNYILTLESEDKIVYLGNCSDLSTQMLYIKEMIQREKGIEGEFFVDMDLNTGNPVFREKV